MKSITIFVSSPGDVRDERMIVGQVIERIQARYWNFVRLEPVLWEKEPLRATAHFNEELIRPSDCEIFVCILWSRLGSPLPAQFSKSDGGRFDSGTEWELLEAVEKYEERAADGGGPDAARPHLLVYRRKSPRISNPEEDKEREAKLQEEKLVAFERDFFFYPDGTSKRSRSSYRELEEFSELFELHLEKLVRSELTVISESGEIEITPVEGSPFRGLEAFDIGDTSLFYGRFRAIEDVLSKLKGQRKEGHGFLLIYGGSGSGKSSLMRAGVAARLIVAGYIKGATSWKVLTLYPGRLANPLSRGLVELFVENGLTGLAESLSSESYLASDFPDIIGPGEHVLLLLDQLEEIFTNPSLSLEEREGFFDNLASLSLHPRIWILATMRSEYFPEIALHSNLFFLVNHGGGYILSSPELSGLNQIIRFPALAAGLSFEIDKTSGETVSSALYDEACESNNALPLLQFALQELWDRREDNLLTWEAYNAIGGLKGAVRSTAENSWKTLASHEKGAAEYVFGEIVSINESRVPKSRRADLDVVRNASPGADGFISAFLDANLLLTDREDGRTTISVAHDSLLETWPVLSEWVKANRENLQARNRLSADTSRWVQSGRMKKLLLSEGRLAEAEVLRWSGLFQLTENESDYVKQSKKRATSRLRFARTAAVIFGVVAIMAVAGGIIADVRKKQAVETLSASYFDNGMRKYENGEIYESLPYFSQASRLSPKNLSYDSMVWSIFNTLDLSLPILATLDEPAKVISVEIDPQRENLVLCQMMKQGKVLRLEDLSNTLEVPHLANSLLFGNFSANGNHVLFGSAAGGQLDVRKKISSTSFSDPHFSMPPYILPEFLTVTGDDKYVVWSMGELSSSLMGKLVEEVQSPLMVVRMDTKGSLEERLKMMETHFKEIRFVTPHPNRPLVLTGSEDKTAALWNVDTMEKLHEWRFDDTVISGCFSKNGERLALASLDKRIRVISTDAGSILYEQKMGERFRHVVFSEDGRYISGAMEGSDGLGWCRVWDGYEKVARSHWMKTTEDAIRIDFDESGSRLLSLSEGGGMILWNWSSKQKIIEAYHPDANRAWIAGDRIVSIDTSGRVRIWATKEKFSKFEQLKHVGEVRQMQISLDGNTLLSVTSKPVTHQLWDVESGTPIHPPVHHAHEIGKIQLGKSGEVVTLAFDNASVLIADRNGNKIESWNRFVELDFDPPAEFDEDAFKSNYTSSQYGFGELYSDSLAVSDDLFAGCTPLLTKSFVELSENDVSADQMANVGANGMRGRVTIHRLNSITGKRELKKTVQLDTPEFFHCLGFSDHNRVLFGLGAGEGQLFYARLVKDSWSEFSVVPLKESVQMTNCASASEYPAAVGVAADHTLRFVEILESGTSIKKLVGLSSDPTEIAITHDGKLVAACESPADDVSEIGVWKTGSGKMIHRFACHRDDVNSIEFSSDGRFLLTTSDDKTAQLWSIETGRAASLPLKHDDWVREAIFHPDQKSIFTASDDSTVRRFPLNPQSEAKPNWALEALEIVAGFRTDRDGKSEAVTQTEILELRKVIENSEMEISPEWQVVKENLIRSESTNETIKKEVVTTGKKLDKPDGKIAGEIFENSLGMRFRWCPEGSFQMGSKVGDIFHGVNEFHHIVELTNGFWIGETEVTQRQLEAITGVSTFARADNAMADPTTYKFGSENKTKAQYDRLPEGADIAIERSGYFGENKPAIFVSYQAAIEACQKLNEMESALGNLPEGYEYRLPTEAEWEYACRAGTAGSTWAGEPEILGLSNSPTIDAIAWYGGNNSDQFAGTGANVSGWKDRSISGDVGGPHLVALKRPNPWGLFDTLGNVKEWCSDWYSATYNDEKDLVLPRVIDPKGPTEGTQKVARGGGWENNLRGMRSASRSFMTPTWEGATYGFRVVLAKKESSKNSAVWK